MIKAYSPWSNSSVFAMYKDPSFSVGWLVGSLSLSHCTSESSKPENSWVNVVGWPAEVLTSSVDFKSTTGTKNIITAKQKAWKGY